MIMHWGFEKKWLYLTAMAPRHCQVLSQYF